MSFRTAYSSLKSDRNPSKPQGYLRDPTPKEWKKVMDDYHKRQKYPSSWSRWG
jgi:hypothetical protein